MLRMIALYTAGDSSCQLPAFEGIVNPFPGYSFCKSTGISDQVDRRLRFRQFIATDRVVMGLQTSQQMVGRLKP